MGKIIYNNVMGRWMMTKDVLKVTAKDSVFRLDCDRDGHGGYDDPTYLTFKVEFGDWGASVLPRQVLDLGVTTFNALYADYDQLPIGLLNCPPIGDIHDSTVWQDEASMNSYIFNETPTYSAFTYLRSRNEDVRAEYIYHFVNALMDIQSKTPYIFKKISGLDALETIDFVSGQRIKDNTMLTLECYEGLDLKMKTLMELYRKAAWDDVYQRWILPENMREFKMIIYIFERRTFQNPDFQMDDLNYDIPVKVYECCPCEFMMDGIWGGDYDTTYDSGEVSTQIKIKVKNVRTFYKNGLMNADVHAQYGGAKINPNQKGDAITRKIESLLIYDLVDHLDRCGAVIGNKDLVSVTNSNKGMTGSVYNGTLNSIRGSFMYKDVFLANEDFSESGKKHQTWQSLMNTGANLNLMETDINAMFTSIRSVMTSGYDTGNGMIDFSYFETPNWYDTKPDNPVISETLVKRLLYTPLYNNYCRSFVPFLTLICPRPHSMQSMVALTGSGGRNGR